MLLNVIPVFLEAPPCANLRTELGNALPVCLCSQAAGDSRALLAPSRPRRLPSPRLLPPAPVLGVMDVPSLAAQQDRAASLAAGQLLAQGIFAGKDHHEDLFLISPAEFQLTLNVP